MKKSVDVIRSYFSPSPNPLTTQMYEQLMIIKNEAGDHIDEWFDENLKSGTSNEVDFLTFKDSKWHRNQPLTN